MVLTLGIMLINTKQNTNTGTSVEYSIVFRLAEQYLIRAEARARQGELSNAKQDLDMVRSLAGLPNTTANTEAEIIEAVQQERRYELFTEYGHRFFDLKRNGALNTVLPIRNWVGIVPMFIGQFSKRNYWLIRT
jgi:hypothetical protein